MKMEPMLEELCERLGYQFDGHDDLLRQALTHKSFANEKHINNERLEFVVLLAEGHHPHAVAHFCFVPASAWW